MRPSSRTTSNGLRMILLISTSRAATICSSVLVVANENTKATVVGRALFGGAARHRGSRRADAFAPRRRWTRVSKRRADVSTRTTPTETAPSRRMSCRRCSRRWACDMRGSPRMRSGRSWGGACANTTPTPTARCLSTSSSVCTTRSWRFPRSTDEVRARVPPARDAMGDPPRGRGADRDVRLPRARLIDPRFVIPRHRRDRGGIRQQPRRARPSLGDVHGRPRPARSGHGRHNHRRESRFRLWQDARHRGLCGGQDGHAQVHQS